MFLTFIKQESHKLNNCKKLSSTVYVSKVCYTEKYSSNQSILSNHNWTFTHICIQWSDCIMIKYDEKNKRKTLTLRGQVAFID